MKSGTARSVNLLAQEFAQILIRLRRVRMQSKDRGLRMRPSELMMLSALVHSDTTEERGTRPSDMGTKLQITRAAVTHCVNSLVAGDFVERVRDPLDRRIVRIKPTGKGMREANAMKTRLIEHCEGLVAYLGERDSRQLIRLLGKALLYLNERREANSHGM
jgi:DNA-binding MarR family transcriptional regulator